MKETYNFLQNLEANNNKEWFDQNRETYQRVRLKFMHITEVLINEIRCFDPMVTNVDPKGCMYRIFRDVRFSNDKTPYKNNLGTHIARNGRKSGNPGYYFHVQPGGCFISGGIYMPQPEFLTAIRNEIYYHANDFLEITEAPEFKNNFAFFDEDKLKTNPKGYPKDFEHIDLLRNKSFAPYMSISEEQLYSSDLLEFILEKFRLMQPLNQFLYDAIDNIEPKGSSL